MFSTTFQNEKNVHLGYKKKKLNSRKIDVFPKELTHRFVIKINMFKTSFFQAIQGRKMCFAIFQNEKTPFQAIKTGSSKSRKIAIFPKGLTHGFGPKMAIFPTFFFSQYRPGKCLLRYSRTQKRLTRLKKQEVQKVKLLPFLQMGLTHNFGVKMPIFPTSFFQVIYARKMSFTIFSIKKNVFLGYKIKNFKKSKN